MLNYVDPDNQIIAQGPGVTSAVDSISTPRATNVPIQVKFVRNGSIYDPEAKSVNVVSIGTFTGAFALVTTETPHGLSNGASVTLAGGTVTTPPTTGTYTISSVTAYTFLIPVDVTVAGTGGTASGIIPLALRWTVKQDQKFDDDALAQIVPGDFVKTGTGSSATFTGYCNYITVALNTLLGVDSGGPLADVAQTKCMAELVWAGAQPGKTNWVTHWIRNDLYKGDETAPVTTNGVDFSESIGNGDDEVTVTFGTPLASANWHFLGAPLILNKVDGSPLAIWTATLTARSASGFTISLSAATDSANYKLEGSVRLN